MLKICFSFCAVLGFLGSSLAAQTIPTPPQKPEEFRKESEERSALRHKIGQLIVIGFQGNDREDKAVKILADQIERGEVGGVLFLGHNIPRSGEAIKDLLSYLTEKQQAGNQAGLLVALDQEGGKIQRLKPWHGISKVDSAAKMLGVEPTQAYEKYKDLACELSSLGFNWNLGPVVDLASNPKNPVITRLERAYSADPVEVAVYGGEFVRAHRACGLATSLKHFPGHGSSGTDSHKGLADITRTWEENELEPYTLLFEQENPQAVMVGHLVHREIDPDRPSSLSKKWVDGMLRTELGYEGLVLTDDLDMRAISDDFPAEHAALESVVAGHDIILIANGVERLNYLPRLIANAILNELEKPDSRLTVERLEQSFERVKTFKINLGLETN